MNKPFYAVPTVNLAKEYVKSGSKPKEKDDKDTVFTQIIYDVTKDNHFFPSG
jgi:hypothetical protein